MTEIEDDFDFDTSEVNVLVRTADLVPGYATVRIDRVFDHETDKGKRMTKFVGTVLRQDSQTPDERLPEALRGKMALSTGTEVEWIIMKTDKLMWREAIVKFAMVMTGHTVKAEFDADAEAIAAMKETTKGAWDGQIVRTRSRWIIPKGDRKDQKDTKHQLGNLIEGRKGMVVDEVTENLTGSVADEEWTDKQRALIADELFETE